jgi:hypothetical protein
VLYLNFSDGTENILKADGDDAARNRSMMGSVTPYPAFTWPGRDDLDARGEVVRDLTRQVHDAFLPYNVVVTATRPVSGPYTMVMIGGSPDLFGMEPRVAGVAFMDCENRQDGNVVFAFPAPLAGSVQGLFSTIAQEAGHALGLQHSSDPHDIMYPRVDLAQRSFQDRDSPVASPKYCGQDIQNSHRRLLELVGAWEGPEKPMFLPETPPEEAEVMPEPPLGGCTVAGRPGARRANGGLGGAGLVLLAVFALGACGRRRGRL